MGGQGVGEASLFLVGTIRRLREVNKQAIYPPFLSQSIVLCLQAEGQQAPEEG
jgi:hypothetical protein